MSIPNWSHFTPPEEELIGNLLCKDLRIPNFYARKSLNLNALCLACNLHIRKASAIGAVERGCIAPPINAELQFPQSGANAPMAVRRQSRCECPGQALHVFRTSLGKPLKPQALPFGRQFAKGERRTNAREGD